MARVSVISSEDRRRLARPICDHVLAVHPCASAQVVEAFVSRFLRNETPEDLAEKIQFGLPMHLAKCWGMLQQRGPDKPQIEAYVHKIPQGNVSFNRTIIHILQRDMPFLVDSTLAVLQRFGKKVQYFTECDFAVLRDEKSVLVDIPLEGQFTGSEQGEVLLRFEIRGYTPEAELSAIREAICGALHDVDLAVKDWLPMRGQVEKSIKELGYLPPSDEVPEVAEFLSWLDDHHFTFLGYREFPRGEQGLGKNCLGLFRKDEWLKIIDVSKLEAHHDAFLQSSDLIWFNQTKEPATVHRPIPMDVIVVKVINSSGQVIGVRQFLGLSASVSYNRSPRDIPILRLKVRRLLLRSGYSPHGYTGRLLIQVLEHFPRDELFQSSENLLFLIVTTVLRLGTHQKVALFVRRDPFGQFLSCLVYVAKDLYSARLREVFGDILAHSLGAEIKSAQSHVSDFAFARLHFMLATDSTQVFDSEAIARKLEEASLSWSDRLQALLTSHFGEEAVQPLVTRYSQAFPLSYQERFAGDVVIADIKNVEKCLQEGLQTLVYSDDDETGQRRLHIKLYNPNAPIPLAIILPILKNLDFNVAKDTPYRIAPKDQASLVWIQDLEPMGRTAYSGPLSPHVQQRFQEALAKVWGGEVESDGFNRLLLRTGLTIWQIQLLRAYCKFLKQIGFNLSQSFMEETLSLYPQIAEDLVSLFEVKFDPSLPASQRELECTRFKQRLEEAFESIATLDQDRIIRKFYNLICVTVRTNAYQREADGARKPYLSFKFDSGLIEELPAPRPYYEIFVYSARMEAVHLRGGKVARGGIRWSDRREDFRTEVLGLLKAQMVKNAVIVPVGSKGGFVVKNLPSDPQAQRAEVITCYVMMMRGLLDITDNMSGGETLSPPDVVAYDDADPYLVVAADKGTATFSDIANGLSQQYGFWLGDAFASGGSSGYDHKKMGITARGAWESTRRHFRELGMNPDVDSFTVAGVGDLSGDIFGNGMLLSRKASLIAAFNHQHIFIDPSPDLEKSFAERKRMFALSTSTWRDYDPEAISSGGGVFSRLEKWIPVSPEMAAVLDISAAVSRIQPNELIHHILTARVDLMWFGGIGTFVKAGYETHMDVGDRTNDALRVNANEMRCRVVVEGANLGMTQEARIQCALMGVKINTDALDNSAGVSCSDHEVNIKILLSGVMQRGLLTLAQRNELLASMTDAVADLVLRDNYLQNSILSLKMNHVAQSLENHALLIKRLEDEGILDRVQSNLPNESALAERMANQQGLTRPELAVLIAHTKIWIYNHLLASSFLDEQALEAELLSYFPMALQEAYREDILNHPLRREILATVIANKVVNRFGGSIVSRLDITTGVGVVNVVSAIYRVIRIFSLEKLWRDLERLDSLVQPQQQIELLEELNKSLEKAILWCIQHVSAQVAVVDMQEKFTENLELLMASFGPSLSARDAKAFETQVSALIQQNVTESIARRVVKLNMLADSVFDIIETAMDVGDSVQETMRVYFYLSDALGLGWARETLDQLPLQNTWQRLSRSLLSADLLTHQRTLVHKILKVETSGKKTRLESWLRNNAEAVERITMLVREMQLSADVGLANIDILSRSLANLAS